MHWNLYAAIVLGTLAASFALDLIANGLNLRWLSKELPPEVAGLFDEQRYRRSQEYTRARTVFGWVSSAFQLGLYLCFWMLGGFGRLDVWLRSLGWSEIPTGLLYFMALGALGGAASLPFSVYATFVLEERFGFNRTTIKTFVLDLLKGLLVAAALGLPLAAAVLWFFSAYQSSAWLLAWGAVMVFLVASQIVFPIWILPLFYRLTPLAPGELREALLRYARKVDFPLDGVFVIDGSRRSSKANAFFTGLGKRRRVALFDTLLEPKGSSGDGSEGGTENETLDVAPLVAIVAHEVGHAKKRHIPIGLALSCLHLGGMLFLLQVFLSHRGLYQAFGVAEPSVYVGLVLFGLLASPIDQLLSIGANALSRRFEFQADRFAASTTGEPEAMRRALRTLARDNLTNLTPHPMTVFLEYSHPPLAQRLAALGAAGDDGPARLTRGR